MGLGQALRVLLIRRIRPGEEGGPVADDLLFADQGTAQIVLGEPQLIAHPFLPALVYDLDSEGDVGIPPGGQ